MYPHWNVEGELHAPEAKVNKVYSSNSQQGNYYRPNKPTLNKVENGQRKHVKGDIFIELGICLVEGDRVQKPKKGLPLARCHRAKDQADKDHCKAHTPNQEAA
jgi:hypothetical protein